MGLLLIPQLSKKKTESPSDTWIPQLHVGSGGPLLHGLKLFVTFLLKIFI
jgi:hypothetical protein